MLELLLSIVVVGIVSGITEWNFILFALDWIVDA